MIQSNSGGIPAYMNVAPAGNGYNDGFSFGGGGGYSGHSINDKMIASLEHIMDDATTDYERAQIQSEIDSIRMRGMR